jgi:hypothetical protein
MTDQQGEKKLFCDQEPSFTQTPATDVMLKEKKEGRMIHDKETLQIHETHAVTPPTHVLLSNANALLVVVSC